MPKSGSKRAEAKAIVADLQLNIAPGRRGGGHGTIQYASKIGVPEWDAWPPDPSRRL